MSSKPPGYFAIILLSSLQPQDHPWAEHVFNVRLLLHPYLFMITPVWFHIFPLYKKDGTHPSSTRVSYNLVLRFIHTDTLYLVFYWWTFGQFPNVIQQTALPKNIHVFPLLVCWEFLSGTHTLGHRGCTSSYSQMLAHHCPKGLFPLTQPRSGVTRKLININ